MSEVGPAGAIGRFAQLAALGPLDAGALAVAAALRPPVDTAATLATLDEWARRCERPTLDALRAVLFGDVALTGASDDYGDPEHSMLDAVVARRRGIPITLSIVVLEVARRVGLVLEAVGMPGHFLVGVPGGLYCDAFAGGALLDAAGAERRFRTLFGGRRGFSPGMLAPVSRPQVLARVLANLEASRWAADPARLRTMLELHRNVPALSAPERLALAARLDGVGAYAAAAVESDAAAAMLAGAAADTARARARAARARMN